MHQCTSTIWCHLGTWIVQIGKATKNGASGVILHWQAKHGNVTWLRQLSSFANKEYSLLLLVWTCFVFTYSLYSCFSCFILFSLMYMGCIFFFFFFWLTFQRQRSYNRTRKFCFCFKSGFFPYLLGKELWKQLKWWGVWEDKWAWTPLLHSDIRPFLKLPLICPSSDMHWIWFSRNCLIWRQTSSNWATGFHTRLYLFIWGLNQTALMQIRSKI